MKLMLVSVLKSREVRVAIVNSNGSQSAPVLHDLHIEKFANRSSQGNIFKAKVVSINDQLQAAFVDFGDLKHGLLTLDKVHYKYGRRGSQEQSEAPQKISDVLKVNDDVLVQVERDARVEKGAALTGQIQLHGQHVVLNTNRPITRISRQITREQRTEIESMMPKLTVPKECGLVVRTSARGRSLQDLQTDVRECTALLKLIEQAYAESEAPRLLYEANNLVNSVLRDNLHNNIERVIVDDESVYEDVCGYVKSFMADFAGEIQLYREEIPLYTKYRIEAQVSKVFDRTIDLPSGGQIVLDPTEALLTIDVNSAQFRFNDNFRDMVLNTNLEAADEIFNQLRLRDIGGLIVVDFIDLYEVHDIRKLEDKVARLCDLDRGRTKWEPISSFGLMELQRRRPRSSIYDTDFQRCDGCGGHGYRQTVDSVGHRIFREIEARSHSKRIARIRARVTPAVAQYLTNDLRPHLSMVEMRSSAKLEIVPDQDGEDASFVVESFSTTYSKTPIKTKSFEHGIPENGKGKRGKINRETPAESIQTAAVQRPQVERKPMKKVNEKSNKDRTVFGNVLGSATKFWRFVPAVPAYLYERLFLVENQRKGTKEINREPNDTRKAQRNNGSPGNKSTATGRVKQKITRRTPNKNSASSSQSKRLEERTQTSSIPTTKSRGGSKERTKTKRADSSSNRTAKTTVSRETVQQRTTKRQHDNQESKAKTELPASETNSQSSRQQARKTAIAVTSKKTTHQEKRVYEHNSLSDKPKETEMKEEREQQERYLSESANPSLGTESTGAVSDADHHLDPNDNPADSASSLNTEDPISQSTSSKKVSQSKPRGKTTKGEIQVTVAPEPERAKSSEVTSNNHVESELDTEEQEAENETQTRASNDPRLQPKSISPNPVVTP